MAARCNLGIPTDARVVLFASGCDAEIKGVRDFLRAMAELKLQEPRLVCLMPSFTWPMDPAQRTWTWKRRLAAYLGIYRKNDARHRQLQTNGLKDILVVGEFTYHMEQWLAAADVVCVPHILPHFSRTVLEAGAMRRPVVAYRIGGITEVVEDGKTGLLVPVGDVRGLAAAVRQLLGDKARRQSMGQHGYEQTLRISAAETSAARVLAIYRDLLKEPIKCS